MRAVLEDVKVVRRHEDGVVTIEYTNARGNATYINVPEASVLLDRVEVTHPGRLFLFVMGMLIAWFIIGWVLWLVARG